MNTTIAQKVNPGSVTAHLIRTFRALSPDMPMQQADVLLCVANRPGLTMNDIAKLTGLSQSSISRNVAAMSKYHRLGKPGLDLVEAVNDPRDPRRRLIFLTQNGKIFITRLYRAIDADFSIDRDTDARVEVERLHEEARAQAEPVSTRGRPNPKP